MIILQAKVRITQIKKCVTVSSSGTRRPFVATQPHREAKKVPYQGLVSESETGSNIQMYDSLNPTIGYGYRTLLRIITAFRFRGHYAASLNPLNPKYRDPQFSYHGSYHRSSVEPDVVTLLKNWEPGEGGKKELDFTYFVKGGAHRQELVKKIANEELFVLVNDINPGEKLRESYEGKKWSINQAVEALTACYTTNVGVEISHIENHLQNSWLLEQIEENFGARCSWVASGPKEQLTNLDRLMRSDHSAGFIKMKYPGSKVFGIEGCESLLPGMWSALERATHTWGLEGLEIGMAHRGRINVLHNFLGKSLKSICNDFSEADQQYGDVKYHLGTRAVLEVPDPSGVNGPKSIYASLAANPSHLEAVNPVVIGKCKAKQLFLHDDHQNLIMPILLHGDASFTGQGVVPECMELSNMPDYTVGGCIHIIINNQIGFTTDPRLARTSYHCTDSAKGVGAPIFHVNGDDVDAVASVCRMAVDWRMKFNRDCVVDIVCYRRHGHNELDDPFITHPRMYRRIKKHPTTLEIYAQKLIHEGVITEEEFEERSKAIYAEYDADYKESKSYVPDPLEWLQGNWQGNALGTMLDQRPFNQTGVKMSVLRDVGAALTYTPPQIKVHRDVQTLLNQRAHMMDTGKGLTWAMAEALAFGTLLTHFEPQYHEGFEKHKDIVSNTSDQENLYLLESGTLAIDIPEMKEHPTVYVRLSGQDCIRGTFNQRHAAIYCQDTNEPYWQLNNIDNQMDNIENKQATITVCNSSLSEFAVLGFEYGFSLSNEMALTIFEAQFGDFTNNAQCIIDNFIASGEQKWNNESSLVLLLPHGYDGQGPEHSSARLERFLQLVDDDCDNIPGTGVFSDSEIEAGFDLIDSEGLGYIRKDQLARALAKFTASAISKDQLKVLMAEMMIDLDVRNDGPYQGVITKTMWKRTMAAWLMKHSERKHNMIVAAPSTPANYFHVLRRQIHSPYSKPLVVMTAKWMLHHKHCTSDLSDMTTGTYFQRVIAEGGRGDNTSSFRRKSELVPDNEIRRVVFCSGKIFYHLYHGRQSGYNGSAIKDVTIVRLEQIAPFPYDQISPLLLRYKNADIVWCQEEPKNMGAYNYVKARLETSMDALEKNATRDPIMMGYKKKPIIYVGRAAAGAPATGGIKQHQIDQRNIINGAFEMKNQEFQ